MEKLPISLCMIVKDEEDCLERCLMSAAHLFQEVIIVDTGSKDRTVEIAKRFTDKVYFHEWKNDFSLARNQSLSYATCDWVFIMDADEELEPDAYEKLKKVFIDSTPKAKTYCVYLINILEGKDNFSCIYHPRIFDFKDRTFHYTSIVHNHPLVRLPIEHIDVKLYHYGYSLDIKEKLIKKAYRTLSLLQKKLEKDPDNFLDNYHIVKTYNVLQRGEESFRVCKKLFKMYYELKSKNENLDPNYKRFILEVARDYFVPCTLLNKKDTYIEDTKPILEEFPDAIDIIYNCACLLAEENRLDEFEEYADRYEKVWKRFEAKQVDRIWDRVELRHRFAMHNIECLRGIAREMRGLNKEALERYRRAISLNPSCTRAGVGILTTGLREGLSTLVKRVKEINKTTSYPDEVKAEFIDLLYDNFPPQMVEYLTCITVAEDLKDSFSSQEKIELAQRFPLLNAVIAINTLLKGRDRDIFDILHRIKDFKDITARLILAWGSLKPERLCDTRLKEYILYDEFLFYQVYYRSIVNKHKEEIDRLISSAKEINHTGLSKLNRLNLKKLLVGLYFQKGDMQSCFNELEVYLSDLFDYLRRLLVKKENLKESAKELIQINPTPINQFAAYHILWKYALEENNRKDALHYCQMALKSATDLTQEYAEYLRYMINKYF